GLVYQVGFESDVRLLAKTPRQIKGDGDEKEYPLTEVSVDGAAFIPDEYVADEAQKLHLYRRLAAIEQLEAVDALRRELRDRYGQIPEEVETLLATRALRLLGSQLGIERILVRPWDARVNFRAGVMPPMAALEHSFSERQFEVELVRPMPLSLVLHRRGPEEVTSMLSKALRALTREQSMAA